MNGRIYPKELFDKEIEKLNTALKQILRKKKLERILKEKPLKSN